MFLPAFAASCIPHDDPSTFDANLHLAGFAVEGGDQTGHEGDTLPDRIRATLQLDNGAFDYDHTVWVTIRSGNGGVLMAGSRGYGTGVTLGGNRGTLSLDWVLGPSDEPQVLRFWTLGDDTVYTDVHATSLPADTTSNQGG